MNKADVILHLVRKLDIDKKYSEEVVDAIIKTIGQVFTEKKSLTVKHFGKFKVYKKKPRVGRNPKTGKEHPIKGRYKLVFYSTAVYKKLLNK